MKVPVETKPQERAAIILAGGEGTRLRALTRKIAGVEVPKQFCPVIGQTTLLEQTYERASLSVMPERILTVVTRAHHFTGTFSPITRRRSGLFSPKAGEPERQSSMGCFVCAR
jgi:mannose-1-phosphate guanylyltransferase